MQDVGLKPTDTNYSFSIACPLGEIMFKLTAVVNSRKMVRTARPKNECKDEIPHFHQIKYLMSVQAQLSPKCKMLLSGADI